MKIELKMNGKECFDPLFDILYDDDKTKFLFGITKKNITDYSFFISEFSNQLLKLRIDGPNFIFENNDKIVLFNTRENFSLFPKGKSFKLVIVILDENGKIVEQEYPNFTAIINENNNK